MKHSFFVYTFVAVALLLGGFSVYQLFTQKNAYYSLSEAELATPFPTATVEPDQNEPTINLVFVGDIMLDRTIRTKAQQNGYDLLIGPQLKELLTSADYGIANLEGPITSNQSVSVGSAVGSTANFLFTFAPEVTTFLNEHNLKILNLGNNHILNFGVDGLAETYSFLDTAQLNYFGFTGTSQPENSRTFTLEKDDYTIGFVNYNQFIVDGENQAFEDIETLKSTVDYLIVYTHWGNEYVPENKVLIDLAHRFVDDGVDLVIGSHPHVITGHEIYQDKHIYYSLGNFIFDQYFDEEVKKGMVVTATINLETKATEVKESSVVLNPSGQTELSN